MKELTRRAIKIAFKAYNDSELICNVHAHIRAFDHKTPGRDAVFEKIVSLVTTSRIDDIDLLKAFSSILPSNLEQDEEWHTDIDQGGMNVSADIVTHQRTILDLIPSERRERLVCLVNLANSLEKRFRTEGSMKDLAEIITHRRAALQLTPQGHEGHIACLEHLANSLHERFRREGGVEDLTEVITFQSAALQLTPPEHPDYPISLAKLLDYLDQRLNKSGDIEDLTKIINLRRVALQPTLSGHPDYLSLVKMLDYLDQRFNRERGMEDLTEIINLRRTALQFTPPGHQERFVSLVKLLNNLHERFVKGSTLTDLDEIIVLRRAALECTPPTPSNQRTSLLDLASSLRERHQRLGADADLVEAIKHAGAALARCPPEDDTCRGFVIDCLELKIRSWRMSVPKLQTIHSGVGSSEVKQKIRNIATEITKPLPLRLLNTYTGALCDRDAQISFFEDSFQYHELLSSPECGRSIGGIISKFFGYTTLSHRWGPGEPLLRDVQRSGTYGLDGGEGCAKLQNFCALSLRRGYIWAWSDTCCIDKDSSSELQEAIQSMFCWYHNSGLTIVHLSDVSGTTSFTNSVWFKRGWTLQELLASSKVLFYTQDWSLYMNCTSPNHKTDPDILPKLQAATGIGKQQLEDFRPGVHDARSKLHWASTRHTTRAEDVAYSLFGIFQVSLPVMYGETTPAALGRLLERIISQSGDVSVLEWVGEASPLHSYFPASLEPYRDAPRTQPVPCEPSETSAVDLEKEHKLYNALAQLPSPRFVGGRLVLPCIVHEIEEVKLLQTSSTTTCHDYEVTASGLEPLKITLSCRLQERSSTLVDLPCALVRPCDLESFHSLHVVVPGRLLEWLAQPFNALLLQPLPHNEYRRIASGCPINTRVKDLASVDDIKWRTLDIV